MNLGNRLRFAPLSFALSALLLFSGCAIKLGPDLISPILPVPGREPVLRIGEITESLTGTWTQDPGLGTSVIRSFLIEALKEPDVASRFSSESSNLTVNIDLTSDHESTAAGLSNLGALSIATLGIIPLNFFSQWDVDCKVTVLAPDGIQLADYVFQERGTYRIWAFPLTMFTLAGAGIRGNQDARTIWQRIATNLSRKIVEATDKDYAKFSSRVRKTMPSPEAPVEIPQPLIP